MPQAKSTKKNQVPPNKLATNPLITTIVVQMAKPAADSSVYLQLWDFVLRFFILILLWFVGLHLHLPVIVLHHLFLLISCVTLSLRRVWILHFPRYIRNFVVQDDRRLVWSTHIIY